MNKQVSPTFTAIVVIIALLLGALYFLVRYRASETQAAFEKAALQRQAERMRATRGRGREARTAQRLPQRGISRPPGSPEEQGSASLDE